MCLVAVSQANKRSAPSVGSITSRSGRHAEPRERRKSSLLQVRPRWWRLYGPLEFDRPLALPLTLVPRLLTLHAAGGLYPNSLACSEAADEAIGGALFAEELIALPLAAATTELVSDTLEEA